jgi:nitroreductase
VNEFTTNTPSPASAAMGEPAHQARLEFFEVLRIRRSVRAYEDRPVEPEKLQRILAAANSAPSAGNLQAYEIVVIRNEETRQAMVKAAYNQAFIAQAPVMLLFCAHPARSEAKYGKAAGEFFALQDATVACAYAELAAAALGLGAVWIAVDGSAALQVAGLSQDWRPVALLPLGYRGEVPPGTPRRHLSELVHEHGTH